MHRLEFNFEVQRLHIALPKLGARSHRARTVRLNEREVPGSQVVERIKFAVWCVVGLSQLRWLSGA